MDNDFWWAGKNGFWEERKAREWGWEFGNFINLPGRAKPPTLFLKLSNLPKTVYRQFDDFDGH